MAKLVSTSPERVEYARTLGLDPTLIREAGFFIDMVGRTPTGRKQFRVTYRTITDRVIELYTTIAPPWF